MPFIFNDDKTKIEIIRMTGTILNVPGDDIGVYGFTPTADVNDDKKWIPLCVLQQSTISRNEMITACASYNNPNVMKDVDIFPKVSVRYDSTTGKCTHLEIEVLNESRTQYNIDYDVTFMLI